ncbi:hypothetical protein BJV74DRAFT_211944 [Russula compacta]|nr:hypothetical protein BJV74DRAFT_211944 [Russula compacta]
MSCQNLLRPSFLVSRVDLEGEKIKYAHAREWRWGHGAILNEFLKEVADEDFGHVITLVNCLSTSWAHRSRAALRYISLDASIALWSFASLQIRTCIRSPYALNFIGSGHQFLVCMLCVVARLLVFEGYGAVQLILYTAAQCDIIDDNKGRGLTTDTSKAWSILKFTSKTKERI